MAASCLLAAPPAAASSVLYAAATAVGSGSCADPADACDLATALGEVAAGGVIQLVTPGEQARYVGNWAVSASGTSASQPVTIEAAPGLSSRPVLDGDGPDAPSGETCSTASCDGPVLTVPGGEFVALSAITIADGNNTGSGAGGGLDNAGTITITGCRFTGNSASMDGGAVDNADGFLGAGTGSVTVTASAFTGNTAENGAVIDNGVDGEGSVTVTASTFTGNTGAAALDNGGDGDGSMTVTASTFTGNTGGAIDNAVQGTGSLTVTASTFTGNAGAGAIDTSDDGGDGSLTVTASRFTSNTGGAIDSGARGGGGSVTVTASTFTKNSSFDGGAIDSGDQGGGLVTVTASTFTGNTAKDGGAIDSGDFNAEGFQGSGEVLVTASTFTGNTAKNGGAIDSGDFRGSGEVTVTASTFAGNTASVDGDTINGHDHRGKGLVSVAGDVFSGSCGKHGSGSWMDLGYNAGSGATCFTATPPRTDVNAGSTAALKLSQLADHGGPTQTIRPKPGSPVIGIIPNPTTVTLNGGQVRLCPATDQRGEQSAPKTRCDAGALQTSALHAITITDPRVPGAGCQAPTLAPDRRWATTWA